MSRPQLLSSYLSKLEDSNGIKVSEDGRMELLGGTTALEFSQQLSTKEGDVEKKVRFSFVEEIRGLFDYEHSSKVTEYVVLHGRLDILTTGCTIPDSAKLLVKVGEETNRDVQFRVHPKFDKIVFANERALKVVLKYKLIVGEELTSVSIRIPLPYKAVPIVEASNYYTHIEGDQLIWDIPVINKSNKTGELKFIIENKDEGWSVRPLVSFSSSKSYCQIEIADIVDTIINNNNNSNNSPSNSINNNNDSNSSSGNNSSNSSNNSNNSNNSNSNNNNNSNSSSTLDSDTNNTNTNNNTNDTNNSESNQNNNKEYYCNFYKFYHNNFDNLNNTAIQFTQDSKLQVVDFEVEFIEFVIFPAEEGGYWARALGHKITTQGETLTEIKANVIEATELYFEYLPKITIHFVSSSEVLDPPPGVTS